MDNSCGLSRADCEQMLDAIAELVSLLKNDDAAVTRVTLLEFGGYALAVRVLFELDDFALQRDASALVDVVRRD